VSKTTAAPSVQPAVPASKPSAQSRTSHGEAERQRDESARLAPPSHWQRTSFDPSDQRGSSLVVSPSSHWAPVSLDEAPARVGVPWMPSLEHVGIVQRQATAPALPAIQRRAVEPEPPRENIQRTAAAGLAGSGGSLPHLERIQRAFGRHDVSGVRAHVGGAAEHASQRLDATAYTVGAQVAFARSPDLHTAAHEAAHVVQQRRGVHLPGGIGRPGDRYEQHADRVAAHVVAGQSVEALLDGDESAGPSSSDPQRVQRKGAKNKNPATNCDGPGLPSTTAGIKAHTQIQEDEFHVYRELYIPRATKDKMGPAEPLAGTRRGKADIWVKGDVLKLGEIKTIKQGDRTATKEAKHYVERHNQWRDRQREGRGDADDEKYAEDEFKGATPTAELLDLSDKQKSIGTFREDASKDLHISGYPKGALLYSCKQASNTAAGTSLSIPGNKKKDQAQPGAKGPGSTDPSGQARDDAQRLGSKLAKIFPGRVTTNVTPTEKGVKATLRVSSGELGQSGILLHAADLEATAGAGGFSLDGSIDFSDNKKRIDNGSIKVKWGKKGLSLTGSVGVKQVFQGLKPFKAQIQYRTGEGQESLVLDAKDIGIEKKLGVITVTGTAKTLSYDFMTGDFRGSATLGADLRTLGKVGGGATISNGELQRAELKYQSPVVQYPRAKPIIVANVGGTLVYEKDTLAGDITGTASLQPPELTALAGKNAKPIQLEVQAGVKEGALTGSLLLKAPVSLGTYFRISTLEAKLDAVGDLSSRFQLELLNIKGLDAAGVTCVIDKQGFRVEQAALKLPFGTENATRMWGTITLGYGKSTGFKLGADAWLKVKDGLVAHGNITYDGKTNSFTAKLTTAPIQLLRFGPTKRSLFKLGPKQITVFSLFGLLGLYLDVGFDLSFEYDFKLSAKPTLTLTEFSLQTFDFKALKARVALDGALIARLLGTPRLGLGAYAIHPKLLRGGGGITIPVAAEARLVPKAVLEFEYTPDGKARGNASANLALLFGIKGAVRPFAEFVVLDGLYQAVWQGDELANFVLLPERELFNFQVDFNKPLKKQTNPALPASLQPPKKASAAEPKRPGNAAPPPPKANKDQPLPKNANDQPARNEGGFNFQSLVPQLLSAPKLKPIKDTLDSAGKKFEQIAKVKKWFSGG
jgi:Domain of unknown function (DUF4157)